MRHNVVTLYYTWDMKKHTAFRLTDDALRLLDAMATARGISRTAMLEIIIREGAARESKRTL